MNQANTLRIVIVVHSHLLGGIERHAVSLIDGLAARGHTVAYAGPLDGWLGERMQREGHPCLHLPMHGMYDWFSARRLARFCTRFGADVVHGHAQRGARYAGWSARRAGLPAVVTAHSTNAWKWFGPETRLIAVSGAVYDFLLAQGLPAGRLRRVYSGIPDLPHARRLPRPADAPLRLGMVARLVPEKGHDLALAALAQVRARRPCRLVVAGSTDTAWAAGIRQQITALGLDDGVEFLGERDDVPALLADFDILLAPSRREALSLTLIEAAAARLPIIATRVGGNPEIVLHEQTGLLVEPEDVEGLAAAILRLADQPAYCQQLGAAGRARFESLFTLDSMLANTEAVYREAIAACQEPVT